MMIELKDLRSGKVVRYKEDFVLGRLGGDNDVCVEEGSVSARHARVYICDGAWHLEDLGSSNGTYIGDETVQQPFPLEMGLVFRLYDYPFEVVSLDQVALTRDIAIQEESKTVPLHKGAAPYESPPTDPALSQPYSVDLDVPSDSPDKLAPPRLASPEDIPQMPGMPDRPAPSARPTINEDSQSPSESNFASLLDDSTDVKLSATKKDLVAAGTALSEASSDSRLSVWFEWRSFGLGVVAISLLAIIISIGGASERDSAIEYNVPVLNSKATSVKPDPEPSPTPSILEVKTTQQPVPSLEAKSDIETPYQRFRWKWDDMEKRLEQNPTLLTKSKLQELYTSFEQAVVEAKLSVPRTRVKRPTPNQIANQKLEYHLRRAEVYRRSSAALDKLHRLILKKPPSP
jgi:hypothetical protein